MYRSSQNSHRTNMTPFEVNFPGIPFMMSFPERDASSNPSGQKQSVVTKTYSTSSRTMQTFSDGKLVQKQTFQEDTADTVLGSQFKNNDKAMSYNTGSRTTNQCRTLTQGGAKGLVTTGSRVEFKSGNESYNTQVGKDVKTASNQFETRTEDDFRYFSEIPSAFSQIKLDDQDHKGNTTSVTADPKLFQTSPVNPDAIPMWGPDKMGKFVDDTFSKMPPPMQSNDSASVDLFLLEQQMQKMQEDLCEMTCRFHEGTLEKANSIDKE